MKNLFGLLVAALITLPGPTVRAQQTAGATASVINGFVVSITVTNAGSGYPFAPLVTITGGGGSNAVAFAVVSNGLVSAITITNPGAGYTDAPSVTITPPSTTPFAGSLILDLPLDGDVLDQGPYHFPVTSFGGTFTTNRFGTPASALALNGVDQNVILPYNTNLFPTEMTFSAWINPQQFRGVIWRVGNASSDAWRGYEIRYESSAGQFQYQDYTGSGYNVILVSSTNPVPGRWSQVVVTRSANTCAIFLDGTNVAIQTGLTPYALPEATPLSLGANNSDPTGFFNYSPIDFNNVHIYNRALASNEVTQLYTAESTPTQAPPTITCPAPLTLECTNGGATGTIEAEVQDTGGNAVLVVWTLDGILSQTNEIPAGGALTPTDVSFTASFETGDHVVGVSASDGQTAPATCSTTVSVQATTPPQITSIVATPDVLWPPDHRMVPVRVVVDAIDNCDPAPDCRITRITSNEPKNRFEPDWQITGPLSVDLRAERLGNGYGRIYTITIECKDASGNVSYGTVDVTVPHSVPMPPPFWRHGDPDIR